VVSFQVSEARVVHQHNEVDYESEVFGSRGLG